MTWKTLKKCDNPNCQNYVPNRIGGPTSLGRLPQHFCSHKCAGEAHKQKHNTELIPLYNQARLATLRIWNQET